MSKISVSVPKKLTIDHIIEDAWNLLRQDYNKKHQEFLKSLLGTGKQSRYFDSYPSDDQDLSLQKHLFPYFSEDDVVLKLAYFIYETAHEWGYDAVVHGQKYETAIMRKRKHGRFHEKLFRPDLTVMLLKKGSKNVKKHGFETAAIEIKFIQTTRANRFGDYGWVESDVRKLNRLVRRHYEGLDRGYLLCVDETCSGLEDIVWRHKYLRGKKRIGIDVFYPQYAASFGVAWDMLEESRIDLKMMLLKNSVISRLKTHFRNPQMKVTKNNTYYFTATELRGRLRDRFWGLDIRNKYDGRGRSNSLQAFLAWEDEEISSVSLDRLSTPKEIDATGERIAKKLMKRFRRYI